jgi:prophage DNA circulation protein
VEGAISTGLETAQDAVSTAASAVAGGLETAQDAVSTAASAVAGGLETAQGVVSTAATAVADGLGSASSYLQEKEFAEMATDLTALIRRYPVQSLLVGVGLGYVLARLTTR